MQDMQAEKLKEQLCNMLMERKREAKKAFDMAGAWSKDAASRPAGRLVKKGDDSAIKALSGAKLPAKLSLNHCLKITLNPYCTHETVCPGILCYVECQLS